jgi:hypothetical protein
MKKYTGKTRIKMNRVFFLIFFKSELLFCKINNVLFLKPLLVVKYLFFGIGIKSFKSSQDMRKPLIKATFSLF